MLACLGTDMLAGRVGSVRLESAANVQTFIREKSKVNARPVAISAPVNGLTACTEYCLNT